APSATRPAKSRPCLVFLAVVVVEVLERVRPRECEAGVVGMAAENDLPGDTKPSSKPPPRLDPAPDAACDPPRVLRWCAGPYPFCGIDRQMPDYERAKTRRETNRR